MPAEPNRWEIAQNVASALAEDIGTGDVTADLIDEGTHARAEILLRHEAVVCGRAWVEETLSQVDPGLSVDWHVSDGAAVAANTVICEISGPARSLLTAERTALNFLQLLSGVATATHNLAALVSHTATRVLDTRKTIPGLRLAQKYAVRCGGGTNHRIGLFDAFIIKENHISAAGSITTAVHRARRQHPDVPLEVEIEGLEQLAEAQAAGPDRIMLDNFSHEDLRLAVAQRVEGITFEASGGIDETTIAAVAETGVDFISVGAITKNLQATDFSLRIREL